MLEVRALCLSVVDFFGGETGDSSAVFVPCEAIVVRFELALMPMRSVI